MQIAEKHSISRPQVIVLGIDGLPYSLAEKLAARGKPGFRKLFTEGSAVQNRSSVPYVSCTAWTNAASGKNPGKHGIFGFIDFRPMTYKPLVPLSTDVQCRRIWQNISDAGKKVAVLGVPVTYPPAYVNGTCVSGFLAPDLQKAVFPPAHYRRLRALDYKLDVDPLIGHLNKQALIEEAQQSLKSRVGTILSILQEDKPDFFFAHVIETDRLNHFLYDQIEAGEGELAEAALAVYDIVDDLLRRVIETMDSGTKLIVCSDHGFCTIKKSIQLNAVLDRLGWTSFIEGARAFADITPAAKAFSLDPGRVYIHTSSRFPKGKLPEQRRDSLAEELRGVLAEELIDPETDQPVYESILTRCEAFSGALMNLAPDLVVVPERGYEIKGALPDSPPEFSRTGLTGAHTADDALFAVIGSTVSTKSATITDVGPSALHLMNIEPEGDFDGRVIVE